MLRNNLLEHMKSGARLLNTLQGGIGQADQVETTL